LKTQFGVIVVMLLQKILVPNVAYVQGKQNELL